MALRAYHRSDDESRDAAQGGASLERANSRARAFKAAANGGNGKVAVAFCGERVALRW